MKFAEEDKNNSPAFTGDVLFHIRLDAIIKSSHQNKVRIETINEYISCLDSLLSEIYYWMKKEEGVNVGEKIRADLVKCREAHHEYLRQAKRVKNPSINIFKIKMKLDDIFFKLNFQAHQNKLILKRRENPDAAFEDM